MIYDYSLWLLEFVLNIVELCLVLDILFSERWRWSKSINFTIKALVEIKSMNKFLTPVLDSPLQYNFSNYYVSLQK